MTVPVPPPLPAMPTLSIRQVAEIAESRRAAGKVRRAAGVGKVDGWSIAIFGGLSLLLGLGSWPAMGLGAAMLVLGVRQIQAANALFLLDPAAPRRLAMHQLILGGLIAVYAAVMAYRAARGSVQFGSLISGPPELAEAMAPYQDLAREIAVGVYVLVAGIAVVGCGLAAWYYASRRRHVSDYLAATPAWITDLQRAGLG